MLFSLLSVPQSPSPNKPQFGFLLLLAQFELTQQRPVRFKFVNKGSNLLRNILLSFLLK